MWLPGLPQAPHVMSMPSSTRSHRQAATSSHRQVRLLTTPGKPGGHLYFLFAKGMVQLYLVEPTTHYPPPPSQARPGQAIVIVHSSFIVVHICDIGHDEWGKGLGLALSRPAPGKRGGRGARFQNCQPQAPRKVGGGEEPNSKNGSHSVTFRRPSPEQNKYNTKRSPVL